MKNIDKTNEQLLKEIDQLRVKIAELEESENEHKKTVKRLKESEEKYRSIFEGANDGILHVDKNLIVSNVNSAFTEITGISKETIIGKSSFDLARKFVNFKQLPLILNTVKSMIVKKAVRPFELNYQDKIFEIFARKQKNGQIVGIIRDITERKQVEAILEREKKLTQQYLDVTGIMLIALNKEQEVTLINPKGCEILNYPKEEILGQNWFDKFVQDENIDKVKQVFNQIVSGNIKAVEYYENSIIRKDGSKRIIAWHNSILHDSSEEIIGLFSSGEDITERKKAEGKLIESENKYRSFTETSTDIILTLDTEGRFTYISPIVEKTTGYPWKHFLGRSFTEIIAPEYTESTVDRFKKGLSGEKSTLYEIEIRHKDGERIPVELNASNLFDQKGKVIGRLAVVRDISERKQVEKKLYKEMNFSQTLLQASPAFYVAISAEGKTIMVNDTMLHAIGYKQEEVVGKDYMTTLVPERNREELSGIFDKLVQLNRPSLNENYILTKDGKELLVEWHGRPVFNEKDEFDYFFGLGIDITERKQAEEELRKYREHLEELVKERTAELEEKNEKLEYFNKLFVGREFRIKELRDKVKELEEKISDI